MKISKKNYTNVLPTASPALINILSLRLAVTCQQPQKNTVSSFETQLKDDIFPIPGDNLQSPASTR